MDILTQTLLESMNLTPEQWHELEHPENRLVENAAISDCIRFFEHATQLMICGDYDCDGVMSTSLAVLLARKLNLDVGFYIPNRIEEGYGVKIETIQKAYDKGYRDLLIIDNGVKAQKEIDYAHELGMNVAVIDHHIIDEPVRVGAFLHPDVCGPYEATMCATGLIYCLAETMGYADDYMAAMAATATIADVMPLWGKNREIVIKGLDALNRNQFEHFDQLVKRTRSTEYTAKLLSFQVIPKINTVGRMSDKSNVNTVVTYMTSQDHELITSYSKQLISLNEYRKKYSKQQQTLALSQVDSKQSVNIIAHENFHEGLVGIVANHIAQKTLKPTVVLAEYDTYYKGSARSMTTSLQVLFESLDPKYFDGMGGHDFAYGMTVRKEYYASFVSDIQNTFDALDEKTDTNQSIIPIDPAWITQSAIHNLKSFEPYGEGFKLPMIQLDIPADYRVINLNGYGFKFIFDNYVLDEAVFFTQRYDRYQLNGIKSLVGSLDLESNKTVLFVEEINS